MSIRYARQEALWGEEGQRKLAQAHVAVIGAGGLGSPALLYLAGAGVGRISLFDDDVVSPSNLHRQVIHTTAAIGTPKTDSAAAAVRAGARGGVVCPNLLQRPGSSRSAGGESLIFRASSHRRSRPGAPLQQIWTSPRPGSSQESHAHHRAGAPAAASPDEGGGRLRGGAIPPGRHIPASDGPTEAGARV